MMAKLGANNKVMFTEAPFLVMKDNPSNTRTNLEDLVLQIIENQKEVSVEEIKKALRNQGSEYSFTRDVVLKLVEEGKAHFNDNWLVETKA